MSQLPLEENISFVFFILVSQMQGLYDQLERSTASYFEEIGVFDHLCVADWYLLHRAGLDSRQYDGTVLSKPQPLELNAANAQLLTGPRSKADSKGSFLLDVGVLGAALTVPLGTGV